MKKLRLTLAAFAAIALIGTASATTFDAKTAPLTANANTATTISQVVTTFTLHPLKDTDNPVLSANAKKPSLIAMNASPFPSTVAAGAQDLDKTVANSGTLQLPNGQVLTNASDAGRAGLALGHAAS